MNPRETSTPIMETFKVTEKRWRLLDKLKTWLVVQGDLKNGTLLEDKRSPTASFWLLKIFLAHLKARVKQLDFIEAFLQANIQSRIFITIPAIFGTLFPEYKAFCGVPLRPAISMYTSHPVKTYPAYLFPLERKEGFIYWNTLMICYILVQMKGKHNTSNNR